MEYTLIYKYCKMADIEEVSKAVEQWAGKDK